MSGAGGMTVENTETARAIPVAGEGDDSKGGQTGKPYTRGLRSAPRKVTETAYLRGIPHLREERYSRCPPAG